MEIEAPVTEPAVQIIEDGARCILRLAGAVDITRAADLHSCAGELRGRLADVVVDCTALERLDSSAIQILLALQAEIRDTRRGITFEHISEQIREFVALGGFPDFFAGGFESSPTGAGVRA